ncbi:hypothetical protein K7X08_017548 [Anisodus acutangulus]|uniref:Gnk2-homologous domain-containing protein n=1 Tax=Anisodus acutangulus TaxID=402998 RepID=A0A9Q1R8A8_9SOLA|nr:hypothetical protein K7X08_017548 [Anisodus acutangulus]
MANVVVLCLIFLILPAAIANPRTELVYKFCGVERADNVSEFNQNYANAIVAMEPEIKANKFSIYGEGLAPNRIHVLAQLNLKNDQFRDVAPKVVKDVVNMAPIHGGYAEGRRKERGFSVYGMANCWNTLDEKSCADCLLNASTAVLDCLPSIEARSLSVGCYFRYSEYESSDGSSFLLNTKGAIFMYLAFILVAVGVCIVAILVGYIVGTTLHEKW